MSNPHPSAAEEPVRVYVGADRSQALAIKVLEYSIRRHATLPVEVIPMIDLPVPAPRDPRNGQRTGFSFSRFCIPALAGYRGRAIYMDADMQVFKDIRSLWELPFEGAKVLIQKEVLHLDETLAKKGAPKERRKQCAVMLLDCGRLDWNIERIVKGLDDGAYDYAGLMFQLCILPEHEVGYGVPFEWNSLEYFDQNTCLLHYTDMNTQPWVSPANPLGQIWYDEVRRMLADGALALADLEREVELGYFRPSLIRDVRFRHRVRPGLLERWDQRNARLDKAKGFVMHRDVYAAKKVRDAAIKAWERSHGRAGATAQAA